MTEKKPTHRRSSKKLIGILALVCVGMFGFGYALVPLYNVLCDTLGINGKTNASQQAESKVVDNSRVVRVQFLANKNANLPWEFRAEKNTMDVHPGETKKLSFYAKNDTDRQMTIQAIPSVTPGRAARHLKKTECFCFTQQTFKAHQAMDMPLLFHIDTKLPKDIKELTLSYTLFEVKHPTKDKPSKQKGMIN